MAGTTTPNMESINLDQACKFLIQDDPDFKKQVKKMILENLRVPESTTSASTANNPYLPPCHTIYRLEKST